MPDDQPDERRELDPEPRRILFLDDDPGRASVFLERTPAAVWVETVVDCLEKLQEPWDEIHLDHDLGGEIYVDIARDDCGMEVVRRLCLEPYPHLKSSRIILHSHNHVAATIMLMNLNAAGYNAVARPFGVDVDDVDDHAGVETWSTAEPTVDPLADDHDRAATRAHAGQRWWMRLLRGLQSRKDIGDAS